GWVGGREMENRLWPAFVRGTVAIHVAKEQAKGSFEAGARFVRRVLRQTGQTRVRVPAYDSLPRGAIIGLVDIIDCVTESDSPWFEGPIGFKLANPRILHQPIPVNGKPRFWLVPASVQSRIRRQLAEDDTLLRSL